MVIKSKAKCERCGKEIIIKKAWQDTKSFKLYCSSKCMLDDTQTKFNKGGKNG